MVDETAQNEPAFSTAAGRAMITPYSKMPLGCVQCVMCLGIGARDAIPRGAFGAIETSSVLGVVGVIGAPSALGAGGGLSVNVAHADIGAVGAIFDPQIRRT